LRAFEELVGACRVPNFRQGRIHGKAQAMHYHVDGTWSAGAQTGTCTNDRTTTRSVTGLFIRHSVKTDPPARTVGLKWTMSGPTEVDCPFTAFAPDEDAYVPGHLRGYDLSYLAVERPIAKSTLFAKKVINAPIAVHGDGHRRGDTLGLWNDGTLTTTLSLTGTITLTRYKSSASRRPTSTRRAPIRTGREARHRRRPRARGCAAARSRRPPRGSGSRRARPRRHGRRVRAVERSSLLPTLRSVIGISPPPCYRR
jgi:hypothetical protein